MRPLMPPVQTPDNLFHDGNPLTGELGAIVDAEHLNNVQGAVRDAQSELITVLTAAGINVDPSKQNQLLTALKALLLSRSNPFADIKSDGAAAIATALSNLGLGDGTGRLINVQTFTASGTYTPTTGTKFVIAEVLGGGGGGGSNAATPSSGAAAGAGGASGSYAVCKHIPTGPVSVVIGAGGSGGVPAALGADGSTGGTTSFGAVSAPGGYGGPKGVAFNNFPTGGNVATGSAPVSSSVIVSSIGSSGSYGILYSDSNATGGGGGSSNYGAGGVAMTINAGGSGTQRGMDANGYGSGGGGAVSVHTSTAASSRGGNGAPGIVIIWEYA